MNSENKHGLQHVKVLPKCTVSLQEVRQSIQGEEQASHSRSRNSNSFF